MHSTYLAEQGEIVKNDAASFLVLQGGSIQRLEAGQRDPRIVTFDRYAVDLSQFTGNAQNVVYTGPEKYIWELLWPRSDDALYAAQPDQYRSELNDRYAALSARLHHPGLCVSRPAANQAAEPHAGATGNDRRGGVATADRLRQRDCRRASAERTRSAICRTVRRDGSGTLANLSRPRGRTRGRHIEVCNRRRRAPRAGGRELRSVMIVRTLSRYFAMRFVSSVVGSFLGVIALAAMIDYVELMRRGADWPECHGLAARKNLDVPRSPAHRANLAVHGAGGRDVVLSDTFAPA
jgi:Lipopolysaccharide export system permease LptF/LptG